MLTFAKGWNRDDTSYTTGDARRILRLAIQHPLTPNALKVAIDTGVARVIKGPHRSPATARNKGKNPIHMTVYLGHSTMHVGVSKTGGFSIDSTGVEPPTPGKIPGPQNGDLGEVVASSALL